MTTEATIKSYRRRTIDKIIKRLALCDIIATEQVDGVFTLYGTDANRIRRSGMIVSPTDPVWSTEECQALLELIGMHGRPARYRLTMRGQYRHWSEVINVQAGTIPMEVASGLAEVRNAEIFEFYHMEDDMRKAPWPDFDGNEIREGDVLKHPTGECGTVVFLSNVEEPADQWRIVYTDGTYSRLGLQIGAKGQAVVVRPDGRKKIEESNHVR